MGDLRGALDLRHQDRIGARGGDGLDVSGTPFRRQPVATDGDLALAVGLVLRSQRDIGAGGFLGVGSDGVLEVEDQRVGRQAPRLLECARVGARHIKNAAARANGLRHPKLPGNAADYNDRPPCGKVTASMHFLSLQSHVAYGYVGNRAATFPLQRLGHEVWAVNTVEFSNHTGYGAWRGRTAPADQVADIVAGIEALGMLPRCDAVLTSYVGDAALADVVLDTARRVRAANARAVWCCDPVLGDVDTGIYVKAGIDTFFRERAIPAADLVTPNHFELEHLTGRKVSTMDEALAAARSLLNGPRLALITSLRRADAPADSIEMVAVSPEAAWRIATPLIGFEVAPNGTGDAVAALFSAHWIESGDVALALGKAASSIFAVLEATRAQGERELQLVAAQDRMVAPSRHFTAEKL